MPCPSWRLETQRVSFQALGYDAHAGSSLRIPLKFIKQLSYERIEVKDSSRNADSVRSATIGHPHICVEQNEVIVEDLQIALSLQKSLAIETGQMPHSRWPGRFELGYFPSNIKAICSPRNTYFLDYESPKIVGDKDYGSPPLLFLALIEHQLQINGKARRVLNLFILPPEECQATQ